MDNTLQAAPIADSSSPDMETIVFGVLATVLALAAVVVTTVQAIQARSFRAQPSDIESHPRNSDSATELSIVDSVSGIVSGTGTPRYDYISAA